MHQVRRWCQAREGWSCLVTLINTGLINVAGKSTRTVPAGNYQFSTLGSFASEVLIFW